MRPLIWYWWDVRGWCRRIPERLAWWLAWMLPRRVAYFAFIRVYSVTGECGPDFKPTCDAWEAKGHV